MGIPPPDQPVKSGQSSFSRHTLKVEVMGPDETHFSVIDVPGIFRATTESLTKEEDMSLVREIVQRYIKNERTIILAVMPANVDIATQEIVTMTNKVDPGGRRTLGVLTKLDLVDRGDIHGVLDLLRRENRSNLRYFALKNPGGDGRSDPSMNPDQRRAAEEEFFKKSPFDSIAKDVVGVVALRKRLREVLNMITEREFPLIKTDISKQLSKAEGELQFLGPSRESSDHQRKYLLRMAETFQDISLRALDARYEQDDIFDDENMRLATRITLTGDKFAESMLRRGCTVNFDSGALPTTGYGSELKQIDTDGVHDYQELTGMFNSVQALAPPRQENIHAWIARVYESSKGFELQTYNPSILRGLFRGQTANWETLATNYIQEVIFYIHRFADKLLSKICGEERIKECLWRILVRGLSQRYKKATRHVKFILCTERDGNLVTRNHTWSENRKEATRKRLEKNASENEPGNGEDTIKDIHDTLRAYYEVSLERFVDNICLQVTDYHLVSGPDTPLRVFSTSFVHDLTPDELTEICAEERTTIERRMEYLCEIKILKDAFMYLDK